MKQKFYLSSVLVIIFTIAILFPTHLDLNSKSKLNQGTSLNQQKDIYVQSKYLTNNYNQNLTRIIFEMFYDILSNGEDVAVNAQFTYQNSGVEDVSNIIYLIDLDTILTESRISSITVYDALGNLHYMWDIIDSNHLVNITLREPLQSQDFYSFTVEYLVENAITSQADITDAFILQWTVTHDENIEQLSVVLTLPTVFTISNQSGLDPLPDYKSSDNRRLEWNIYNVKMNDENTWIIRFNYFEEITVPPNEIRIGLWIAGLFLMLIAGLVIGSISVYFLQKTKTDTERTEIVETLLSKPEKQILKIIQDEGGTITQNKITTISGFSKAKVSYYLTELEKKEIIMRERWGRMNRIKIIDNSVDKVYFQNNKEDIEE